MCLYVSLIRSTSTLHHVATCQMQVGHLSDHFPHPLRSTIRPINYSSLTLLLLITYLPFLNLQRGRTKPLPSPELKTLFNSPQRGFESDIRYDMLKCSSSSLSLSPISAALSSPLCVYVVSCLVMSCHVILE
jgi:hypothetical protein